MNPASISRVEHGFVRLMVRSYPASFRAEYATEMTADLHRLLAVAEGSRLRAWRHVLTDTLRSAPRERWVSWREARAARMRSGARAGDYAGATAAALAVLVLYRITLAPSVAFWDTGEYITSAHVLGIPHPPGNAWFVLVARAWDLLLSVTGWSVATRINLLSAVCSSVAHYFLYLFVHRSLRAGMGNGGARVAAACAVLLSATAFTVWNQSNVNEKVYTVSFATTMATLWLALRWRETRDAKLIVLALYLIALTSVNHLMGVLVLPAFLGFIALVDVRTLLRPRLLLASLPLAALALSAHLFLPLRAAQRPIVNEPDPSCPSVASAAASIYTNGAAGCPALSATLRREQYGKPSILRDPTQEDTPRSAALFASQLLNYVQYLDWQWARSIAGKQPLFGGARPLVTLAVLLLCAVGAHSHWRRDRGAALLHGSALLIFSVGLVVYLNFKYGFVIARDIAPADSMHEVRERDYFFLISFSLFGAWAGIGLAAVWQRGAALLQTRSPLPRLVAAPMLLLALAPMALNWSWASRADDWTARDWAYNALMSVGPYGVLVTNGDNDSFPLWYLQHVEHVREDVSIVLAPYLAFPWYARQVRDASRPCDGDPPHDRTVVTCQQPLRTAAVHPRLLEAWGTSYTRPPEDSILPLSDREIEAMSQNYFVTPGEMSLRAGVVTGVIPAGTMITPVDTFVAAMIRSSLGKRPIHFMSSSPVVATLGLSEHTVRVGLTWKLRDVATSGPGVVALPRETMASTGAWMDLTTTDTLTENVFIRRGRILYPRLPWVDHATWSMPAQYSLMHYAAAVAHERRADAEKLRKHLEQVEFWNRITSRASD